MPTRTGYKYQLYKPDPDDLVDPRADVQDNFETIDSRIYPINKVKYFDRTQTPVKSDFELGWKIYSVKAGQIQYLSKDTVNGSINLSAIPKLSSRSFDWNNLTLSSGYSEWYPGSQLELPAWRYRDGSTNRVELKGKITTAAFAKNTTVVVIVAGQLPPPVTSKFLRCAVGLGTSDQHAWFCRLRIANGTGEGELMFMGSTNSGAESYVSLDGLSYATN